MAQQPSKLPRLEEILGRDLEDERQEEAAPQTDAGLVLEELKRGAERTPEDDEP